MRTIDEEPTPGEIPAYRHPGWAAEFPWLLQGITARGDRGDPFDLAFFGSRGGGNATWARWARLTEFAGFRRAVHGPQVHGDRVRLHRTGPPGILLAPEGDGHLTAVPGVLLTVSVADCVPVYLIDPERRAAALLHAGWRGVAAGIVEHGVESLRDRLGVSASALHLHAGPSICGSCYEVGPEVHEALGLAVPGEPTPVDLGGVVAERGVASGLRGDRVTRSGRCTLCGDSPFFSHRGGDEERQVAFLGIAGEP